MTSQFLTPPERGNAPLALQLELFDPTPDPGAASLGISRTLARSSISPSVWPHVAVLYGALLDVRVEQCHERDGELILRVVDHDGTPLDDIAERIRRAAERICGACGASPAGLYRARLDGPTVRVCPRCRERLRNGESYLVIADDYWALDGSRRVPPRGRGAEARGTASESSSTPLPTAPLPAPELRRLIRDIRETMRTEIAGNDENVSRLALLAGLHVGGGLSRGGRALILGPSGAGKSALVAAMLRGIAAFDLPVVAINCTDLNPPGYSHAPAISQCIESAIGQDAPASHRAERAVVILDELHHVIVGPDVTGSLRGYSKLILSSLLGLTGHGVIQLADARSWSSRHALVIGLGAFTDLLDYNQPVTVRALVEDAGLDLELANRLAVEILTVKAPSEGEMVRILREWPDLKSVATVCARLGYEVRIHEEAVRRAARVVQLGYDRSTLRTAGGWLVSALHQGLIDALEQPAVREIVVTPDSLSIAPAATRPHVPPEPPEFPGDEQGSSGRRVR